MQRIDQSVQLGKRGDREIIQGQWEEAEADYQQALAIWPTNRQAMYGLGKCADRAGNTAKAIRYYRDAIYAHRPGVYGTVPGDGYQENSVRRLMEYVLLLSRAGHSHEALSVYRRAAGLLNYEDGKQNLDVLLPDFSPGTWAYTPQRLQAMAHIAVAYGEEGFDDADALSHLQQAVALTPDSPLPYFYRAGYWGQWREHYGDARADYARAAARGDAQVNAVAKKANLMLR